MNFVFLGTGAGMPAKARNVSAVALQLLEERRAVWLFDCGEGTQHQILHTSVKPGKIEKIFISHLHGDHIYGLPGLLGSRSFQGGTGPLTVYGPKGIEEFILTSLRISRTYLKYQLQIVELEEGIIFEDAAFSVEARKLEHGMESFGFRVTEKDAPGELKVSELQKLGIRPGPIYKEIKAGKTVELDDGTFLRGSDFVGEPKKGKIITILGDTKPCRNVIELARNADYLVHEATFAGGNEKMAEEFNHSTSIQAAEAAKEANAGRLILTHISSRYNREDAEMLRREASEIFPETIVAEDLMTVEIRRNSKEES